MATENKSGNRWGIGVTAAVLCILMGYVIGTRSSSREPVSEPPRRDASGFASFEEAEVAGQSLNRANKIKQPEPRIEALREVADRFPNTITSRLAESSIENAKDEVRRSEEREGYGRDAIREAKLLRGTAQIKALEELIERLPNTKAAIEAGVMLEMHKSR